MTAVAADGFVSEFDRFTSLVDIAFTVFTKVFVCMSADEEFDVSVEGVITFDEGVLPLVGGILDIVVVLSAEGVTTVAVEGFGSE